MPLAEAYIVWSQVIFFTVDQSVRYSMMTLVVVI